MARWRWPWRLFYRPIPWRAAQRSASQYFGELSEVLKEVAGAARVMDGGRVADALARGRALEPVLHTWSEALATGRDISRLSPLRPDRGMSGSGRRASSPASTGRPATCGY